MSLKEIYEAHLKDRDNVIKKPKLFQIKRNGQIVANGCIFPNDKCVVSWVGIYQSVVIWDSYDDLKAVNGHPETEFIFDNQ